MIGLVVAASALVLLAAAGALAWVLSGGWDGVRPAADPSGREVTYARAQIHQVLPVEQARIDEALTGAGLSPLAAGEADGCRHGRNDWKNHEGFTLLCQAATIEVFSLPATDPATLQRIETALGSAGYHPAGQSLRLYADQQHGGARYQPGSDASRSLQLIIAPPQEPDPQLAIYLPSTQAWGTQQVDAVDTAVRNSETSTLTVILTWTYFQDS